MCVAACQLTWPPETMSGGPCSFSKHADVFQSRGWSFCTELLGAPVLSSSITEQNLAQRTSSKHTANGTFICLSSCPLPPTAFIYWDLQCHFQEPHGNSQPCQWGGQLSHDVTMLWESVVCGMNLSLSRQHLGGHNISLHTDVTDVDTMTQTLNFGVKLDPELLLHPHCFVSSVLTW